jgi:hypothetical protein
VSRRSRRWRYGGCVAVVVAGAACGALIPGTAGGTAATVLVGLGLVGIVSLVFYEVGLTEDRDRAAGARTPASGAGESERPRPPGGDAHRVARWRAPDRRRGQRRRLG